MMSFLDNHMSKILLTEADFPPHYVNLKHPQDLTIVEKPVKECIFNKRPNHYRLILRLSWEVKGGHIPVSFICDTGCSTKICLCDETVDILTQAGVVSTDRFGNMRIKLDGDTALVDYTPIVHGNINIIPLAVLDTYGFSVKGGIFEVGINCQFIIKE